MGSGGGRVQIFLSPFRVVATGVLVEIAFDPSPAGSCSSEAWSTAWPKSRSEPSETLTPTTQFPTPGRSSVAA